MKILFVSSYYLFPGTRFGGSKRLYYFAKELEKYGAVHVICHDGCGELEGGAEPPPPDLKNFLYLPLVRKRNFFTKVLEPGYDTRRFLAANRGRISDFIGESHIDAAILAFPLALSFIETIIPRSAKPVLYLEDDLLLETILSKKSRNAFDLYRWVRLAQLRSYYAERLSRVDTFVTISVQEQALVKRHFPGVRSRIVKYGVPLHDYPFSPSRAEHFTVGFVGNFRHVPNADALAWFLSSVLPVLKQLVPYVKTLVAGKDIPAGIRNEHEGNGSIAWAEDIPRVCDFYERISVFVNPIVSGRGLRTKLVESAACGRPMVSTTLGAEGFEDLSILIADTPAGFAEHCKALKDDPLLYARIAEGNRKTVERSYSLEAVGGQLRSLIEGKP
jgi:glycosyltransferase involved in cell wall biosynthesis